jgi:cold shock CspA family protein
VSGPGPGEGTVSAFDEPVGLGTVTTVDGVDYPFHCTQIADGSRAIAVGTPVTFVARAGLPGRWEAFELRPRTAPGGTAAPGGAGATAGPSAP